LTKYRSYQFDTKIGDKIIMIDSGEMLAQMWLAIKPYIDKKERNDAALSFLRAAEDFVDLEQSRDDAGEADSALHSAFAELLGDQETEEDEEEDF
jgi:cation transport regulator ChaB